MDSLVTTSWQCPPFESDPSKRLGWTEEMIQEGDGFLEGQSAYKNLSTNMRIFDGIFNDKMRSTLKSNVFRYYVRKFVETISDVREIGLVGSDAPQYKPFAEIENRVMKAIYQESQYPRQLRKALQWATMGVGYLWPKCKTMDYGWGERRIVFEPLGILDVVPVQVPSSNDVQDAYAVTIYVYMPIAEAHARFPLFQHQLKPIDSVDFKSRIQARRLDWQEKFKYGDQQRGWGNLYCEIRYTFVRDLRLNDLGQELPMGENEAASWFYKVPYIGQDILGGVRDGMPFMRKAKKEDCRIYPQLRLMISSKSVDQPMYDGPAFDWHGMIPPVQYTVDDWVWEAMGFALMDSVGSIEQTKRKHERKIDQILSYKSNPAMGYDRTATGGPRVENFDIFEENQRVGVDGEPNKVLQALLMEDLQVTDINFKFLELLDKMEKQGLGLDDVSTLVNLKLNVGSEGFEKALESIGPIAKGIAGSMEASNAKVAQMLKFMIPQWMDTKRLIEYVGPDPIITEFFDYDPDSMIPSHTPEEYVGPMLPIRMMPDGSQIVIPSAYPKIERARRFARNIRVVSVPNTLLKVTQMQEQTKWMALYGRGFPVSPHTTAKKLGIEGYGDIQGDTEFEKWMNWKKLELMIMAQLKQAAAGLGLGGGLEEGGTGKQHAGGRPPSDKQAPKMAMKDKQTNPRPVLKTAR